jgi:hypothetical protein
LINSGVILEKRGPKEKPSSGEADLFRISIKLWNLSDAVSLVHCNNIESLALVQMLVPIIYDWVNLSSHSSHLFFSITATASRKQLVAELPGFDRVVLPAKGLVSMFGDFLWDADNFTMMFRSHNRTPGPQPGNPFRTPEQARKLQQGCAFLPRPFGGSRREIP